MSQGVSNITGHYKTANGQTLSVGQVICGDLRSVISDISSVEVTIQQDINLVVNTINAAEQFVANVLQDVISYETDAVNYVANLIYGEINAVINVISTDINSLLPNTNFCGLFNENNLSQTPAGVAQYYTLPNVNTSLNYLNPSSGSVIRPLPSQGDQLIGQSQVHRLARNIELEFTDLYKKFTQRVKYIPGPYYASSWCEPISSFNAAYPHNQVMKTRNGIIVEHDDTPGAVRIHNYHPSGSYNEINNTGRTVIKTVDDSLEIVLKDKKLYIKGDYDITVDSNVNIMVLGNCNLDVNGNIQAAVRGNLSGVISGNTLLNTTNDTIIKSNNIIFESNTINFTTNSFNVQTNVSTMTAESANHVIANDFNVGSKITTINASKINLSTSIVNSPTVVWTAYGPALRLASEEAVAVSNNPSIPPTNITPPMYSQSAPIQDVPVVATVPTAQGNGVPIFSSKIVQQHIHNNIYIKQVIYYDNGAPAQQVPSNLILQPGSYSHLKYQMGSAVNVSGSVAPKIIDVSILNSKNIKLNTVISKNCTLGDLTKYSEITHDSLTVVPTTPLDVACNLMNIAQNVVDPLIDNFGRGNVIIASGYQAYNNVYLNDHNFGYAVDIQFKDIPFEMWQQRIQSIVTIIPYDRLIFCWAWNGDEYIPWLHISLLRNEPPKYSAYSYNLSTGSYTTGIQNPFSVINSNNVRTDGIST
jgi:hypothetical protein